eukprot:gene17629-23206_t
MSGYVDNVRINNDNDDNKTFEAIQIKSEDSTDKYIFTIDDDDFPALLGNSPTLLESYKTYDNKVILKSGDIGQILYVFLNENDRNNFRSKLIEYSPNNKVLPSGLTQPTEHIYERRYKHTRIGKLQQHSILLMNEVVDEIEKPWTATTSNPADLSNDIENMSGSGIFEYVDKYEEIVDLEDWMIDPTTNQGISVNIYPNDWLDYYSGKPNPSIELLLRHPNVILKQFDIDEEKLFLENSKFSQLYGNTSTKVDANINLSTNIDPPILKQTNQKLDNIESESDDEDDDDFDLDINAALKEKLNSQVNSNNDSKISIKNETNTVIDDDEDWMNIELEEKVSLLDSTALEGIRAKAAALRIELEAASKAKTSIAETRAFEAYKKVEDLHTLVQKIDSIVDELPAIVLRFKSLENIHFSSVDFVSKLKDFDQTITSLTSDVSSNRNILDTLKKNLSENLKSIDQNMASIDSRISKVSK